jgi:inner membrane protein involved in colicin E2 resistance
VAQEIRQNRGILNRVRLSWVRRVLLKLALKTMAGILSNFFDVAFYALLTITVFLLCSLSLCCFLNKLQALFYHHFTNFIKDS